MHPDCHEANEAAMSIASDSRKAGMFGQIVEWWRDLRAGRAGLDELQNCGSEADNIARDVGLSSSDLRLIAAKRPSAADQLEPRLAALLMDRAALQHTDPLVVRDLERVCTLCGEKRQCERDLARHPTDAVWRTYCPNAPTLQALGEAGSRGRRL
jgi:hypothetical protein